MVKIEKGVRSFGSVSAILEFGVVVELGGKASGLLHVTNMRNGTRPARMRRLRLLVPGERVEVEVVDVKAKGKRTKVSLSERFQDGVVTGQLKPRELVTAEVVHRLDAGLIVSIADGVAAGYDGFVHVSELAGASKEAHDRRLAGAKVGDRLELEVLRVGRDERGDLSIKLSESRAALRRKTETLYAAGTTHTGKVTRRTADGFVVSFGELTGFLPESELGGTNAGSIKVGVGVRSKVLSVSGDLRLTLTRKGL